jgi:DHA2 family multidrug resistance protein
MYLTNLLVVLDSTIANVTVPQISGNLGASLEQGTWVITSFAVAEAITIPLTGWLAGRFGLIRSFVASTIGFTFFSMLCGLSVSLPMLVLCRVGQGLCGGPLMPLSQTIITRIYPGSQIARAIGWWSLTAMLGPAIGPIVGGTIADQVSWHWIFLVNVPIGIILAALGAVLLRPAETRQQRVRVDRVGMALLVMWVAALQLMLDTGRDRDWFEDPGIVTLAIVAVIGLVAFVIWELTEPHPAVDLRLMRHRPFAMILLASGMTYGAYFAGIVVVPQWLQGTLGYSATQSGMITALGPVCSAVASQVTLRLMLRYDARILVTVGCLWISMTFFLRTLWNTEMDAFSLGLIFAVQGFGMPLLMMPLTNMAMSTVSLPETASAAGLTSFVRTISSAITTTLTLTYWINGQAVSRAELAPALHIDETAGVLARAGLSDGAGAAYIGSLVDRQATTVAMDQTFVVAALAMLIAAAMIWMVPRIELTRLKGTQGRHSDLE